MKSVTMNYDEKLFTVVYDPGVTTAMQILEAIKGLGFTPTAGGAPPPSSLRPLSDEERAKLDIKTIVHGEAFEAADHVVQGQVTLFDYYADWCLPCKTLSPKLEHLLLEFPGTAIRKVDIVDWKSAAAKQATDEFKLKGIPHVRVFGPDGEHVGDVNGDNIKAIRELVKKARP